MKRLDLKQLKMNNEQKYTFFWNGPFSQWAPSKFKVGNLEFTSAEQYMMAHKAVFFNDVETFKKIMSTDDPREQKAFGRQVKNFDKDKWESVCKQIVYEGNYAKFSQNDDYRQELMKTIGTELVEASPDDKIWGIGLEESDERAKDKSQWQGTNWLGEVITRVREDMMIGRFGY